MVARLPAEIVHLICQYIAQWTVLPWVDTHAPKAAIGEDDDYISCEVSYTTYLCANSMACDMLMKSEFHMNNISWSDLSRNSASWALDMLEENQDRIDPSELCRNTNPRAFKLLESIPRSTWDWGFLFANPAAIHLLADAAMNIHPSWLMWNPNGEKLIGALKIPIDYSTLAGNPAPWAIEMIKKYYAAGGDVNWTTLCANYHPWAIEKIREEILVNPSKICWVNLSANPGAIDILKANLDKITIEIWENPAIFELTIPIGIKDVIMSI